jgi:four helix bundle protein
MDSAQGRNFQALPLWQKAHQFVLAVYNYSDYFPQKEVFGLTSQFRRAAIAIPASIAEGFEKRSETERARLMAIAQGSLEECRYYLILAKELGYGDNPELMPLLEEVSQLLRKDAFRSADS